MTNFRLVFRLAAATIVLLGSGVALAQGGPLPKGLMMGGGEERSSGPYRTFTMSLPIISMAHETVGHFEVNLGGKATLALEAMAAGQHEEMDEKTFKETGESMKAQSKGIALFVARYTNPASMSGFYWGLGAGYREEAVKWRVQPSGKDKDVNYGLLDQGDMLNHNASLKGTTGHMRVGYRYSAQDLPLLIGGYAGARHFQAGVKNVEAKDEDDEAVAYAPLTERETDKLKKRYETRPEVGVEIGFTF